MFHFRYLICRPYLAQIILCFVTPASILASQAQQNRPADQTKVGQMAEMSPDSLAPQPQSSFSYVVHPQVKTFGAAYVEYRPSTCEQISSGSWAVTTAPKRGATATGIVTGHLGNGDCPTHTFQFAAIYYTWTSADPAIPTDTFAATWSSPHFRAADTFNITLIRPINWQQVGPGVAKPNGVLHFEYKWESTSGKLPDLSQCQVGEKVDYPSSANPFKWPSPPFLGATNNPTILWVAATDGKAQDNHSNNGFVTPYKAKSFSASQEYRYQCRSLNTTAFPGQTGIIIRRAVSDSTGKGCWRYTITKSGASASISPLPHVNPSACTHGPSSYVPQAMTGFKSGGEVSLAVKLADASVGLNEPIFFDLTVLNRSAEIVGLDLGLNGKANLAFTVEDPTGRVVTRRLSSEGFGGSGEVSLDPDSTFAKRRLLLNEWYEFPETGTYRVMLTLLDDATPDVTGDYDRPSTEFSIQITPRNPGRLEYLARELADRAIGGATLQESMEAASALSYIRDPLAIGSLVRVLRQGSLVEHYAVEGLGRIGNSEAIAALEAAQDHPDEDVRAAVRITLGAVRERAQGASRPKD